MAEEKRYVIVPAAQNHGAVVIEPIDDGKDTRITHTQIVAWRIHDIYRRDVEPYEYDPAEPVLPIEVDDGGWVFVKLPDGSLGTAVDGIYATIEEARQVVMRSAVTIARLKAVK